METLGQVLFAILGTGFIYILGVFHGIMFEKEEEERNKRESKGD